MVENHEVEMQDYAIKIGQLKRPKLLIRAARYGARDYRRSRDMPGAGGHNLAYVLPWLLDQEDQVNHARLTRDAAYDAARHVRLLAALLAESRGLTVA